MNIATCLVDPVSRQLIAWDPQAQDRFPGYLLDKNEYEVALLFPNISKNQWDTVFGQNTTSGQTIDTLLSLPDVSELPIRLDFTPLAGPNQNLLLLTVKPASSETAAILHRDALTGLPDRRDLANHHLRWRQTAGKKEAPFAVLFIDIDQFKAINDRFGHAVGDQVLVALADRWQRCVRDQDLVARYGGDEFVVLLANITTPEELSPVIARLSRATKKPILIDGQTFTVSATIGLALSTDERAELPAIISAADRDMYAHKKKQRSTTHDPAASSDSL